MNNHPEKLSTYTITMLCAGAFGAALLLYCLYANILIIRWSSAAIKPMQTQEAIKKKIKIYFYKRRQLRHEEKELLWSNNNKKALNYLVASWLSVLFEEELVRKRVTLQSVILTSDSQAYISFDRSPLQKENSVYEKLLVVESLLKTLRENGIVLQKIQFLVHHQPLRDTHLDFSHPWPSSGYLV